MAGLPAEEHLRLFTVYILSLIREFAAYLERSETEGEGIDMAADYAGYREAAFYATEEELDRFQAALQEAIQPLMENGPGNGRRKHKIATIAHPLPGK